MRAPLRFGLLLALALLAPIAAAQTIAFSFDDGFDPRVQPEAAKWNAQMLSALERAGVKAAYFPAGRFVDSPEGLALVKAWGDAGHVIGNHTYSHADLDETKLEDYLADVARADTLLKGMPNFRPRLRFPFLKEGATAEKRDGVRNWMAANGYQPAPVSIVTSDWYFNQRFTDWAKTHPRGDTEAFHTAYLAHVWHTAAYSEALARETLGRSPAHVMLLHANRINALYLPEIIAMFRARGWTIVAADTAFADPLYKQLPQALPAGNGILGQLAKDAGRAPPAAPYEDHGKAALDAWGY